MIKTSERLDVDIRFLPANERTLLAWIRTSIGIEAGGLALAQLHSHHRYIGIIVLLTGASVALIGYGRYRAADRAIRDGRLPASGHGPAIEVILVVAVAVFLAVAQLTFLN